MCFWAWVRLIRHPSYRGAVHLALWTGALALASPNLTYGTAIILGCCSLAALFTRGRRRLWRPLLLSAALSAVAVAPVFAVLTWVERHSAHRMSWAQNMHPRPLVELRRRPPPPGDFSRRQWRTGHMVGARPECTPWYEHHSIIGHPSAKSTILPFPCNCTLNPGPRRFFWITAGVLGLLGMILRPRRTWPWLVGAAAMLVLAQGESNANQPPLPIPFTDYQLLLRPMLLFRHLPLGKVFANFAIFAPLSAVFLGVAAAHGVQAVAGRRRALSAVAAMGLCLAEANLWGPLPLPLHCTEARQPPGLAQAIRECGDGAVFAWPRSHRELMMQTWHHKPIVLFWNVADPSRLSAAQRRLYEQLQDPMPSASLIEELPRWGTDSLVLLPRLCPDRSRQKIRRQLEGFLGPPSWTGEGIVHFCLRPKAPPSAPQQ